MAIFRFSNSMLERKRKSPVMLVYWFKEVINIIYIKYWNLSIEMEHNQYLFNRLHLNRLTKIW